MMDSELKSWFDRLCEFTSLDEKLDELRKHLQCADVNAVDHDDDNSTLLHMSAKKNQPEIVKFLLQMGADPNKKNQRQQTPLDLAQLSPGTSDNTVIEILETLTNSKNPYEIRNLGETQLDLVKSDKILNVAKKDQINKQRSGTAGNSGQLYESNLIGLLLFRALKDSDIHSFLLGSNITDSKAFDDIVFKYRLKGEKHAKIFFVQAKHRDNPEKNSLTVNGILKPNGDISIEKYFDSYIKIRQKIMHKSNDDMFRFEQPFYSLDCNFILYTPAIEKFQKKKIIEMHDKESLLFTSSKGKIFIYDYDEKDIEAVLKNVELLRASLLAKAFAESIIRRNHKNMMFDDMIKVYHVYLATNVLHIYEEGLKIKGRFRKSFLESKNEFLVMLKETMFRMLQLPMDSFDIKITFDLPKGFGNTGVAFDEDEYTRLNDVIEKLIKISKKSEDGFTIMVDNTMIGRNQSKCIFKKSDIALLGRLVGDKLIVDIKTMFLKINTAECSKKSQKIFNLLEKFNVNGKRDLKSYRFDINVENFPQILLCNRKYETEIVKDFLSKFKFFTNQAKEEEVENILISEVNLLYNKERHQKSRYHVKGDVIYLKYRQSIQKWWKNPDFYLTESCEYYKKAKNDIINSPLLNLYDYSYNQVLDKYNIIFENKVVDFLKLKDFLTISKAKVFNILTRDMIMTCIKVIQHLKNDPKQPDFRVINLEQVFSEDDNENLLIEICEALTDVLVLVMSVNNKFEKEGIELFLQTVFKRFRTKLIVISHLNSLPQLSKENVECLESNDLNTSYSDFDTITKQKITSRKNVFRFQGIEVPFEGIVPKNVHDLVKEEVLNAILNNDIVDIGKDPKSVSVSMYNEIKEFYVNRYLCRGRKLIGDYRSKFNVIKDIDNNAMKLTDNKDILIISDDIKLYDQLCRQKNNYNIHWFQKLDENILLWRKSNGCLKYILPYVKKCENDVKVTCSFMPQLLNDLNEKVVIIGAGPGMGKSTLLTHLMIQTNYKQTDQFKMRIPDVDYNREFNPICVIQVRFLDLTHEFSILRDCKIDMTIKRLLLVLYQSFSSYKSGFIISSAKNSNVNINYTTIEEIGHILFENNGHIHLNTKADVKHENKKAIFEFQTFLNFYNNNKMLLLLDGFDEICPDFKMEAIEMLKLIKTSRFLQLWITSRTYMLRELESELDTFAYTLSNFSLNEQRFYFEKVWAKHALLKDNNDETFPKRPIDVYVNQFLSAILYKIADHSGEFAATPLHLRMIADIYKDYFVKYYFSKDHSEQFKVELRDAFNLITLYEKFIIFKFDTIRFGEKKSWLCSNDPDIIKMKDDQRRSFIADHKKVAAHTILIKNNKNEIFNKHDLRTVQKFIQSFNLGVEKTGIIETIDQSDPIFVHYTFAEYFASEYIFDVLTEEQESETVWMFFINYILVMDNGGMRSFIDAKLEKNSGLLNFTSKYICDALLGQRLDSNNLSALHISIFEQRYFVSHFLLNNLATYVDSNNLDDFLNLLTTKSLILNLITHLTQDQLILTKIVEIIRRLDHHKIIKLFFVKDIPILSVFKNTFIHYAKDDNRNDELLKYLSSKDLTTLFSTPHKKQGSKTILHLLLYDTRNLSTLRYLEELDLDQLVSVFNARDVDGRVPAHYAASYDNYAFFEIMERLIGIRRFKQICRIVDKYNYIPLMCAYPTNNVEGFTLLCEKAEFKICPSDLEKGTSWYLYDKENHKVMLPK